MSEFKIILVAQSTLFREGLMHLLAGSKFSIESEYCNIHDAIDGISPDAACDLVLVDVDQGRGFELTEIRYLSDHSGHAKTVILSNRVTGITLMQVLDAGVDGYLLNNMSSEAFIHSLSLVMAGETVFPTELADILRQAGNGLSHGIGASVNGLTPREIEILQCLIQGDANKVIANRLDITEATVKVHLKALLKKIRASNRTQAAIWAIENGFNRTGSELR